jgi:hypothetical protein
VNPTFYSIAAAVARPCERRAIIQSARRAVNPFPMRARPDPPAQTRSIPDCNVSCPSG